MKFFISLLCSILGASSLLAGELGTWTFSGKTENEITITFNPNLYPGTIQTTLKSLSKTPYSGTATALTFMTTSGTVIAGRSDFFTPNVNVQTAGSWTTDFSFVLNGETNLENITLNVISFGSSGAAQGVSRTANFSVYILDEKENVLTSENTTQAIVNGTTGSSVEFSFANVINMKSGSYTMRITATKATETLGSFFGLRSIVMNGVANIEDVTTASGYVLKSLPAGKSTFVSINVQRPTLLQTEATFLSDESGLITMTADSNVNFSNILDATRSYLLEVQLDEGSAVFILNRDIWKNEQAVQWNAISNVLTFESDELRNFIRTKDVSSATIRIRLAWTIDEVFGTAFREGHLKSGSVISGDAIYVNIDNSGNSIKTYFTENNGWKGNAIYAAQNNIGAIPIHPCMPIQVFRKAGEDCEIQILGEVFSGNRFVRINTNRERLSSADAFPQQLGATELELENPISLIINGSIFFWNVQEKRWQMQDTNEDASNVSVEDGVLFLAGETSPEFILFKQSELH